MALVSSLHECIHYRKRMQNIMLMIAVNIGSNIDNDCHMTAIDGANRRIVLGIMGGVRRYGAISGQARPIARRMTGTA
jgi:hypothetical protein